MAIYNLLETQPRTDFFPQIVRTKACEQKQNVLGRQVEESSGWCFQVFFIFIPTWGNDPI